MGVKGGPTTQPIPEMVLVGLTQWIDDGFRPEADAEHAYMARVAYVFLRFGMHPSVLCYPRKYNFAFNGRDLVWYRPKTGRMIEFPLTPEQIRWLPQFLLDLPPRWPIYYNRLIHRVGERIGFPALTPRALRHTAAREGVRRHGWHASRQLLGVTDSELIRYARDAASREEMERVRREGF